MSSTSRFSAVTRRAALQGASLAALTGLLAACSNNDSSSLGTSSSSATAGDTTAGDATSAATTATSAASGAATATTTASTSAASGSLPSSAKGTVSLTFQASSSGGMTKNPYVAIWIEDSSGAFVQTLQLWYQSGHGEQWLSDLTKWYQDSGGDVSTSSGTTSASSYTVTWDAGSANVKPGSYYVCVEGAVEHGNYELLRKQVTLGSTAQTVDLGSQNDISGAKFTWTV